MVPTGIRVRGSFAESLQSVLQVFKGFVHIAKRSFSISGVFDDDIPVAAGTLDDTPRASQLTEPDLEPMLTARALDIEVLVTEEALKVQV